MNIKYLATGVGILAVIAAALFLADHAGKRPAPADPRVGQPLASPELLADVTAIRVLDAGEPVVRLLYDPSVEAWILPEENNLPVNFRSLSRLINQMVEARILRFVTRKPERLERIDPAASSLLFYTGTGTDDPVLELHFGKRSDSGGMYVQFNDNPSAYLADTPVFLPTSAESWIDMDLFPFAADAVRALTVHPAAEGPDPSIELRRESADAEWELVGEEAGSREANPDTVNGWLRSLENMRFTRAVDPDDPEAVEARQFVRRYTVETADGTTWQIALGRRPERTLEGEASALDSAGETAGSDSETEPETVPAGTPYAFVEVHSSGEAPVIEYGDLAFALSSWVFEQQPPAGDWTRVGESDGSEPSEP